MFAGWVGAFLNLWVCILHTPEGWLKHCSRRKLGFPLIVKQCCLLSQGRTLNMVLCICLLRIPILSLLICKLRMHFYFFPSNLHFYVDITQKMFWILLLWISFCIFFSMGERQGAGFALVFCIISWIELWAQRLHRWPAHAPNPFAWDFLTYVSVAVEICTSEASGQIPLSSPGNKLSGGKRSVAWGSCDIWQP